MCSALFVRWPVCAKRHDHRELDSLRCHCSPLIVRGAAYEHRLYELSFWRSVHRSEGSSCITNVVDCCKKHEALVPPEEFAFFDRLLVQQHGPSYARMHGKHSLCRNAKNLLLLHPCCSHPISESKSYTGHDTLTLLRACCPHAILGQETMLQSYTCLALLQSVSVCFYPPA